jgi:branched-chain amino acid transport system substrate-binding protein
MKKLRQLILLTLVLAGMLSCNKVKPPDYLPVSDPVIRIGALLPLTGSGASSGEAMKTSLELAVQDISDYLAKTGSEVNLILEIADTRTDTAEALAQMKFLYKNGIRLVVGPYSSAELAHVKSFADSNGVLVVSPSGVAVSLAIPGDNIFRFAPSDLMQGRAMGKLLAEDKIRYVVPIIRNDLWGKDLVAATTTEFGKTGGVVRSPVKYAPGTTDFTAVLDELDDAVGEALKTYSPNDIAVYLLSFSEGTMLLAEAKNRVNLNNVYWYGGSAFALQPSVLNDTTAALFAYTHGLPCPLYGIDEAATGNWQSLSGRIEAAIGRIADIYAFTAYDALWVMVKSCLSAQHQGSLTIFKEVFTTEAGNYFGVTGNTRLDENGDRAAGNYDFWAVKKDSAGYCWKRVARYNSQNGTIVRQVK